MKTSSAVGLLGVLHGREIIWRKRVKRGGNVNARSCSRALPVYASHTQAVYGHSFILTRAHLHNIKGKGKEGWGRVLNQDNYRDAR